MYEPDPGIELWIPCQALLQPWHSNQDHTNFSCIEDCAHLFEAGHSETIRLVNQNERGRVIDMLFLRRAVLCNLGVRWMELWNLIARR